jgi:hypothetical protein
MTKKQKRGEIYFLQAENKSAPFFCIIGIFACLTRENWKSSMNCLEKEIDSALAEHNLAHEKVRNNELAKLIAKLTRSFFSSETKSLDPFYLKNPQKKHNPDFWKKVDTLENFENPLLIVQDSKIHAWKLANSADLKTLFSETTGFPFWIVDDNFKVLIYMDDHDCVHTSDSTQ